MKRSFLLVILLVLGFFQIIMSQSVAQQRCDRLANGLNLNNWLEDYWSPVYNPSPTRFTRTDIIKMKAAGMHSLRLPICFARLTDSIPPYAVDTTDAVYALIDSVIQWAQDYDMMLIIDNHHAWDIYNDNWRQKIDRFSHLWSVISYKYRNLDPNRYMFELLNEPAFGINLDSLNIVFSHTIDSIRQHTTAHTIIIGPNFSSSGAAFAHLVPYTDTNLIYTWHSYDPYQFTHQGFTWATPYFPTGYTGFPSSYDGMLHNAWNTIINWRNTYHLPVFLGEFGVGENGDPQSRCNWIQYFGAKIDSFNMPWMYWDWDGGFPMFYSHTVSEDSVNPCFKHALHLYGDTSTGWRELNREELPVQLFPNPVSAASVCELKVFTSERVKLSLTDISGRVLFHTMFTDRYLLPMSRWGQGIYFLNITTGDRRSIRKLVVK